MGHRKMQKAIFLLLSTVCCFTFISYQFLPASAVLAQNGPTNEKIHLRQVAAQGEKECAQPPQNVNLMTLSDEQLTLYGLPTRQILDRNPQRWSLQLSHAKYRTCGTFPGKMYYQLTKTLNVAKAPVTSSFNPVSLEVTRSGHYMSLPALHVTITDQKAVQQFYQVAYNLPRLPNSGNVKMNCLAAYDIIYHLKFHSESASDEMDMEPTGCLLLRTSQGIRRESNEFLDLATKTTHIDPLVPQWHG